MRRLFIIFMLTLLPLQASWAAVCAYCPTQCIAESPSAAAQDDQSADSGALAFDSDCNCCQPGSVGMAALIAGAQVFPAPHSLAIGERSVFLNSSERDRPERPKWSGAA